MELEMYPFDIKIDGARADDDQHWRIYRIHRILGYSQALADNDNNEEFFRKIADIYDQKGSLFITWNQKPTKSEMEYLQKAWESVVTDYEANPIEHKI